PDREKNLQSTDKEYNFAGAENWIVDLQKAELDEFMEAQKRLTLEGNIVISVGLFGHSGDNEVWENMDEGTLTRTTDMLDDMHKRKIDMSDEI
ncbi:MAG: hypothetical protein UHU21_05560, partial [Lachnospiraceae bacterium]|nr:hypothetical protein [Lachnospiraceae bacterium]